MQVAAAAVDVDHLAEQERAAVAEARLKAAELMAGVGLRHRRRPVGRGVAGEDGDPVRRAQRLGLGAELGGQRLVERQQPRRRHGRPCHGSYRPSSSRT